MASVSNTQSPCLSVQRVDAAEAAHFALVIYQNTATLCNTFEPFLWAGSIAIPSLLVMVVLHLKIIRGKIINR